MLQGSLENFALDEVLGLLAGTSKTGRLEIAGNRGTGVLSFHSGHLVDATASYSANGSGLEDVMFELLRFDDGTFSFNTSDVPVGDSPENVANVLAAAEGRLRDWRSIESVVPTLKHQVAPATELPADENTISRDEWAALRVIASGCPVSAVCDKLDLGEVEGSRRIKNLAERDLVSINEPIGGYVPPTPTTAAPEAPISTPATESVDAAIPAPPPAPVNLDESPAFASSETESDSSTDVPASLLEPADVPPPPPAPLLDPVDPIDPVEPAIAFDPLGTEDAFDSAADMSGMDRPPMPPAPDADDLSTGIGDVPPAPPSPSEISSFGEEVEDASELVEDADGKGGGLLARYLKSDD